MSAGRKLMVLPYLFGGFLFSALSKSVEGRGDVAPYLPGGAPGDGLRYHLIALVLLIVAGACFIRAGYTLIRNSRNGPMKRKEEDVTKIAKVFADEPAPAASFDADAALARYMQNRPASPLAGNPPSPPRGGFGRKQV